MRRHPPPSLEGDPADLQDTVGGEHDEQDVPGAGADPQIRRHPGERDQRQAEGDPERDRLAPRDGSVPRPSVDREDQQMGEAGEGQNCAGGVAEALGRAGGAPQVAYRAGQGAAVPWVLRELVLRDPRAVVLHVLHGTSLAIGDRAVVPRPKAPLVRRGEYPPGSKAGIRGTVGDGPGFRGRPGRAQEGCRVEAGLGMSGPDVSRTVRPRAVSFDSSAAASYFCHDFPS